MTMAKFLRGQPKTTQYLPAGSYAAGDVIVLGSLPNVAHQDNPPSSIGLSVGQGALANGGGIYQMAADAAYAVGTYVWWDTAKQQVTTDVTATAYPFGWLVGGPQDRMDDGGPTGAASLCSVLHDPMGAVQPPQSFLLANFRNLLDGGDMTVNPAQRGTSQAADIANTLTYGPDRFAFKAGASSTIDWSIVADTNVGGFAKSLKWQRKAANADTAAFNLCQVVETADSVRAQGQTVTLSFWARKGANYSGGNLTVQLESGQGTDQSANNLLAGSWTSQAHVINVTQALTTTMTRYQWTGTVPAATTQLGLILQWTPSGTAGADDSIVLNGCQLEIGNGATPFEHRDVQVELEICQRYFWQVNEPASGVIVATGMVSATNTELFYMATPVQMRTAPAVTVTVGAFKSNSATAGIVAATSLAGNATHTPNQIGLTASGTGTAGQGALLQGGGGTGLIAISADY